MSKDDTPGKIDALYLEKAPIPRVGEWAVARTRSRAEKALVKYLGHLKVDTYLPLIRNRRVYGRHVRESEIPLFPGYLFFDACAVIKAKVLESNKVASILYTSNQEQLREELTSLAIALQSAPVLYCQAVHEPGTPVCVCAGPLKGVRGTFVRRKTGSRLVLRVTLISSGVELEIDEAYVQRIGA